MMDMASLWRRLMTLVGSGSVNLTDDTAAVQTLQVSHSMNAIADKLPRLAEYGFQSSPPAGADAVILWMGGQTSDGVVIATGHQQYRMRSLATGEVAISDDKGQKVLLSVSGIRIEGGTLPVEINTTGGLTINADLNVNGATAFTGTVTANGHSIDEGHKHTGGTLAGGFTGIVTP